MLEVGIITGRSSGGAGRDIKADIEGSELETLRGAREIIRKSKPRLALTTYHAASDVREIERFLSSVRSDYSFLRKGLDGSGKPVMLHAW